MSSGRRSSGGVAAGVGEEGLRDEIVMELRRAVAAAESAAARWSGEDLVAAAAMIRSMRRRLLGMGMVGAVGAVNGGPGDGGGKRSRRGFVPAR